MGERSVIEWTDSTWNPWRGCDKVSPGCAHCYMFRDQKRYGRDPSTVVRAADGTFYAPVKKAGWAAERDAAIAARGRHLVFTCSWSDWFHPDADEWRDEAWSIIRNTPESTYQILTKRPELIADRLPREWGEGWSNVWLGVSIENRRFVNRADILRRTPAAVRFISAEPLLGPLMDLPEMCDCPPDTCNGAPAASCRVKRGPNLDLTGIDWLIVGGESGPGHRPMTVEWARQLRDAANATQQVGYRCKECGYRTLQGEDILFKGPALTCPDCGAEGQFVDWIKSGTRFFFKQHGGARPESGGRLLDDRTWDEMPEMVA
jgi:protein gp37